MGTTAQKLQKILDSKADIKSAIESKNVEVGDAPLDEYADKIRSIDDKATTSQRYCVGRWPTWAENEADAVRVDGDVSLALDWYPVLVDMSAVEGEVRKRPVGWLMRNNFLRFEDGRFAPTVGITEAQRAACDVALYLDAAATQQYCAAGAFNAETFYNAYGMTQKLYDASGNEVRILRPWETTETKYSIFVARKETVQLIDNEQGADGTLLRGIVADDGKVDGIKPVHPLVPTGIAADPCTQLDGKMRCYFFNYNTGNVGCEGAEPPSPYSGVSGELFYGDGTYPRVLDNILEDDNGNYPNDDDIGINQAKNGKYARANNYDPTKPYPVAEGGWHAWNVFISCLEAAYGTKYLHSASRFSSGVSSNDTSNSAANWLAHGGVRLKLTTVTSWSYYQWSATNHAIYPKTGNRTYLSLIVNNYNSKMQCMEAQMALSMAAELNVAPGTEFDFYGHTYEYETPTGATALLNGRMNARLFRTRTMQIGGFNSSRNAATWDVECRMRVGIAEGVNINGDILAYVGGGAEVVTQYINSAHWVRSYLECDQTKWVNVNHTVQQTSDFDFMSQYEQLEDGRVEENTYVMLRQKYGTWRMQNGVSIGTGECCYHYEASLGKTANMKYRAGLRGRGNASFANASPRYVYSYDLVSRCFATTGGSAQVLLEIEGATAAQPQ